MNPLKQHPLFPLPPDKAEWDGEIHCIAVRRQEGAVKVAHPTLFSRDDITSLEQVHESWGGGVYHFEALTEGGARWVTKRFGVRIAGTPKPFPEPQITPGATSSAQPAAGAPAPGQLGPVELLMMMMQRDAANAQAAIQREQEHARARAEESRNFMTIMMGMMNKQSDVLAAFLARPQSSVDPSLMTLFAGLVNNLTKPASSLVEQLESLKQVKEAAKAIGGDGADDTLKTVGEVLDVAGKAKALGILDAPKPSPSPAPPAAPSPRKVIKLEGDTPPAVARPNAGATG